MTILILRRHRAWRLAVIALLLTPGILLFYQSYSESGAIGAAAAKGQLLSRHALPELTADESRARQIALADPMVSEMLAGRRFDFLYARPMAAGEASRWQDAGCASYNCSQTTFYDYENGGTVAAIVQLDSRRVVDRWRAPQARPAASLHLMSELLAIAAADSRVQAEMGDPRLAPATMIPMSTWLVDDACRQDWCIDLTFPSPHGDGRILHVVVNMHRQEVARLFYTRARADRSPAPGEQPAERSISLKPAAQDGGEAQEGVDFENGCQDAHGWEVCWEMTAHDGLDFRDATYEGQPVFSSVKISQVEAYYSAWPGGYRDEIGFDASVPAEFGTHVTELEDGFEVRQLYTEPFDWPNCVCCYRYEQVLRFFGDGAFELAFVSHGPGCDELAIYRPFWRIDLDLVGPAGDQVQVWSEAGWSEVTEEADLDLLEPLSPDEQRLATFDGEVSYRWTPLRTDPLGVDEGRLFLLQWHATEGTGPIPTGPADTFRPPREWVNDESLSGENAVVWYVPILKTKKGGPWWCMPDPEPDFSPCVAILRAEPAPPPSAEVPEATPIVTPTATSPAQVPSPTPETEATSTPGAVAGLPAGPVATPRPIGGNTAEAIIQNAGCGNCHQIGEIGNGGKVGPDLTNLGLEASGRIQGLSAAEYIHQSIIAPNAFIAPDCPNGPCLPDIMPQNFEERLDEAQIATLVQFLLELSGDTVTEEVTPAEAASNERILNGLLAVGAALLLLVVTALLVQVRSNGFSRLRNR